MAAAAPMTRLKTPFAEMAPAAPENDVGAGVAEVGAVPLFDLVEVVMPVLAMVGTVAAAVVDGVWVVLRALLELVDDADEAEDDGEDDGVPLVGVALAW